MSATETIEAAYAAFGRNDPSVLFGAMDPAVFRGDKVVDFQQYTDTAQWARLMK